MGGVHASCISLNRQRTRQENRKYPSPPQSPLKTRGVSGGCGENSVNHDRSSYQRSSELFDNEEDSDVTFLVGVEPDLWRFPGHKSVLSTASPVFDAMFNGPLATENQKDAVIILDVEPKAFENLLRFSYTGDLLLHSIKNALATLYAADKYILPELAVICVSFLDVNLSVRNVLHIYQHVHMYCGPCYRDRERERERERDRERRPGTSSPTHLSALLSPCDECVQNALNERNVYIPLLRRCLETIDNFAEEVLRLEGFESLDYPRLAELVIRDTIQVNSEVTIFEALLRWATQECKRCRLEMTPANRRFLLRESLFSVRFLLMTKEEFLKGPAKSGVLTLEERSWILARILGQEVIEAPRYLAERIPYLERRRGIQAVLGPGAGCAGAGRVAGAAASVAAAAGAALGHEGLGTTLLASTFEGDLKSRRKCCKWSKIVYECFVCLSFFFD